jgi:hypothetical protein
MRSRRDNFLPRADRGTFRPLALRDGRALAFARPRFPFAKTSNESIENEVMKAKKIKNMKTLRATLGERFEFISNSS